MEEFAKLKEAFAAQDRELAERKKEIDSLKAQLTERPAKRGPAGIQRNWSEP